MTGSLDGVPRISGAFASLRALTAMDGPIRRQMLAQLRGAGLTMLLTEGVSIPGWVEGEVADAGLQLGGGVACFSDHGGSFRTVPDSLRPIAPDGAPRPQMEWYRGIIPTDRAYEDDLVAACGQAASNPSVRLFMLDFIRWPLHWELELRAGAEPLDASFDPTTIRRFCEEVGVDLPTDNAAAAAERIQSGFEAEWTSFKCWVVTSVVRRICRELRAVRPDLPLGAFIVPGDDWQRRRYAGQDVTGIGEHVDVLMPMAYQAILGRSPAWVGEVVADLRRRTATPIVPVVQATADQAVAGPNDWGVPFPPADLGQAIEAGLEAGGRGFVVFPAHGLDGPRLAEVNRHLAPPN